MDQNPIKLVKLKYHNKLLCNFVAQKHTSIEDLLRAHNICETILLLQSAWENLSQNALVKSWAKIKNWDDSEYETEDNVALSELFSPNEEYDTAIEELRNLLSDLGSNTTLTLDDIEKWNEDLVEEDEEKFESIETESVSDIETIQEGAKISYPEAIDSVNTLIKWCENNSCANGTKIWSNLLNLRA